jgi:hypothetical protein
VKVQSLVLSGSLSQIERFDNDPVLGTGAIGRLLVGKTFQTIQGWLSLIDCLVLLWMQRCLKSQSAPYVDHLKPEHLADLTHATGSSLAK